MNTQITSFALSLALVLGPVVALATRVQAAGPGTVELTFDVGERRGAIMVALFDSEAGYDKSAPVQALRVPVGGAPVKAAFAGLKPGRYAAKSFHDLNGDGSMNVNMFGIPTEPFGFSNNAPARFGPASWQTRRSRSAPRAAAQTITVR